MFTCENCFPALFYVICASNTEQGFTAIISSCVSLCSMTLCSNRKVPNTDTSHLKFIISNITTKHCFVCKVMHFAKNQLCYQGCVKDFVDTAYTVRNSLSREKLFFCFFKKNVKKKLFRFSCLGNLIHFLCKKILYCLTIFHGIFQSNSCLFWSTRLV